MSKPDASQPPAADHPYCTLFLCTLEQMTALSAGGRDDDRDAALHDMPLALDGAGRPILNGRTLAGALVATARTFLNVPEDISLENGAPDDKARPPSIWSVWNAHRVDDKDQFSEMDEAVAIATDSRISAALRHDTRAPASRMMADAEVLPAGQRWRVLLEVWHPATDAAGGVRAAAILALTLREWQRERCWLGRRVARGLGWMKLTQCQVIELPRTEDAVDAWPNAELTELNAIWAAADGSGSNSLENDWHKSELEDFAAANAVAAGPVNPKCAYVRWPLTLATGVYEVKPPAASMAISYGIDVLSVGGHPGSTVSAAELKVNLVRSKEQTWNSYEATFAPDFTVAMQPGTAVPGVPGSGIAGAWRHYLSRHARQAGHEILDPSTGKTYGAGSAKGATPDPVTALFGSVQGEEATSSALLVKDASMLDSFPWRVALLEKLALDEFTQGAFKGAKFNRMAILNGQWRFDVVQEVNSPKPCNSAEWQSRVEADTKLIRNLLQATDQRRVALGGGEFRAYGHLPVTVVKDPGCQWAPAGEDWQPWPPPPADHTTPEAA